MFRLNQNMGSNSLICRVSEPQKWFPLLLETL
jgi:hypothetical protein